MPKPTLNPMPFDDFIDLSDGVPEGSLRAAAAAGNLPRLRAFLSFWKTICESQGEVGERAFRNGSCDSFTVGLANARASMRDAVVSEFARNLMSAQNFSEAQTIFDTQFPAETAGQHGGLGGGEGDEDSKTDPATGNEQTEALDFVGFFDDGGDGGRDDLFAEKAILQNGETGPDDAATPAQTGPRFLTPMPLRWASSLMLAAQNGHADCVEELLSYHDPRRANEEGLTALHLAAAHGHAHCVALLIPRSDPTAAIAWEGEKGHFSEGDACCGMTSLMMGARAGHAECVKALIPFSNDRQIDASNFPAVFYSARGGSLACLLQFAPFSSLDLESGVPNRGGKTLLMAAGAFHGKDTSCVEHLLPISNPSRQDDNGATALSIAAAHGRSSAVSVLLPRTGLSLRATGDWEGRTLLNMAVLSLDPETIRLVLPFSDPLLMDDLGYTALMRICAAADSSGPACYGDEQCLSLLRVLAPVSDISARSQHPNSDFSWTAMALLSQYNRPKSICWLAALCPPDDARLDDGETPLMLAASRGNVDAVAALLPLSNVNAQRHDGSAALHLAVAAKQTGAVRVLLVCPCLDPNLRDQEGETALMQAVRAPGPDFVELILSLGADVDANLKNNAGRTALMIAAACGNENTTNLLIPVSDCSLRDNEGRTALDIAIAEASEECLPGLMQATDLLDANPQDGRTPLHLATKCCVPDLFLKILARCPPEAACAQDNWGLTPLMLALAQGYEFDALALAPLSDISQRDHEGKTALDHLILSESFGLLDAVMTAVPDDKLQAALLEFSLKCAPVSAARLEAIDLAREAGIGSTAKSGDLDPLVSSTPRRI